jgi:hypothetical protein
MLIAMLKGATGMRGYRMEFAGEDSDGRTVRYVDRKRYLWLLSLTGSFHIVIAIGLYFVTRHNPLTMLYPLAYALNINGESSLENLGR